MYFRCRVFQLDQYDHLHVNYRTFFHIYIHSVTVANVELCVFYQKKKLFFLTKSSRFHFICHRRYIIANNRLLN